MAASRPHVDGVRRNLVDLADPADYAATGRRKHLVSDRLLAGKPAAADLSRGTGKRGGGCGGGPGAAAGAAAARGARV